MTKNELIQAACERLIAHFAMLNQCEETGGHGFHTRIFSHYLHPETRFVYAGKSRDIEPGAPQRLEHVVPCAVLISESNRLISEGKLPHSEIAKLLAKHWKVVHISKREQQRMDYEMGVKSQMPLDWTFENGDTMARLNEAGISLVPDQC